jgi:hypothetical protein
VSWNELRWSLPYDLTSSEGWWSCWISSVAIQWWPWNNGSAFSLAGFIFGSTWSVCYGENDVQKFLVAAETSALCHHGVVHLWPSMYGFFCTNWVTPNLIFCLLVWLADAVLMWFDTTNIAASRLTDHRLILILIYIYHSYARKFLGRDWRQVLQWRHRPGPLPGSSGQLKAAFALPSAAPSTDFRKTRSRVYICDVCGSRWLEAALILCRMRHCWFYVLGPW